MARILSESQKKKKKNVLPGTIISQKVQTIISVYYQFINKCFFFKGENVHPN